MPDLLSVLHGWKPPAPWRRSLVLTADGLITAASLWLSFILRFEGEIPSAYLDRLPLLALLLIACRLTSSLLFRLHRWSFRFSGLTDGARVGMAAVLGTGLFTVALYLLRLGGPPRSIVVLELLISTAAMAAMRFTPRLAWMYQADRHRARRRDSQRTLIVGAGAAGEMLLRDLQRSQAHAYQVLGFVDDDSSRRGTILGGKPVLGGLTDLPRLARELDVAKVLIAIPRLSASRIREILSLCSELKLGFKMLPVSFVDLEQKAPLSMLQDLSPEDLLPRAEIAFPSDERQLRAAGRSALVTGGAGSIGSEICRQLLAGGVERLALVDMDENGLYLLYRGLAEEYPAAAIEAHVADVREPRRLARLFAAFRPDDVFHAAAHKHVPLMEDAPCEAVKNNVLGTLNVARAAEGSGAERFVFISTDKAVRPSSVMGATKRVGEMITRVLADGCETRFFAVRFGNVLGSAGSVVPLFRRQIASGGPVTVTDPEVRRYFMTISEAVGLVLEAAYGDYGTLCVLEMGEQIRIADLARHMITMSGMAPGVDVDIEYTGLRPGEKLYEELLTEEEEKVRQATEKILVSESPPPPSDLLARVDRLIESAVAEDVEATLRQLRELVPSYTSVPPAREPARAEGVSAAPSGAELVGEPLSSR